MRAPLHYKLPDDFAERCAQTRRRTESGDAMTLQQLADTLGLPFEFVAASVAIAEVLASGRPVIVDPAPAPLPN